MSQRKEGLRPIQGCRLTSQGPSQQDAWWARCTVNLPHVVLSPDGGRDKRGAGRGMLSSGGSLLGFRVRPGSRVPRTWSWVLRMRAAVPLASGKLPTPWHVSRSTTTTTHPQLVSPTRDTSLHASLGHDPKDESRLDLAQPRSAILTCNKRINKKGARSRNTSCYPRRGARGVGGLKLSLGGY